LIVELKTAPGYPLYAHHKYPTKSSIVIPTKEQIVRRVLLHNLSGNTPTIKANRKRHFDEDRRETKRIYKESRAQFEDVIKNEESFWHATNVTLENMERTTVQKEANEYWLRPSKTLSNDLRSQLPRNRQGHEDVYCTKRALHSIDLIRKRFNIKHQPRMEMLLCEIDDDAAPIMNTVGMTRGVNFRTKGQHGMYKICIPVKIKRIIRIKFGSVGNLSDPDTQITEVHRKYNKTVSINMKRGVNGNTDLYKNGMFNLFHQDDVDDNESIGEEKYVNGQVPASLDDLEDGDDPDVLGV